MCVCSFVQEIQWSVWISTSNSSSSPLSLELLWILCNTSQLDCYFSIIPSTLISTNVLSYTFCFYTSTVTKLFRSRVPINARKERSSDLLKTSADFGEAKKKNYRDAFALPYPFYYTVRISLINQQLPLVICAVTLRFKHTVHSSTHTHTQVLIKLISGKLACQGAQISWQMYGIWTNKYNHLV
jgi:hypothetical protein